MTNSANDRIAENIAEYEEHKRWVRQKETEGKLIASGFPGVFQGVEPRDWKNLFLVGAAGSGKSYLAAQMMLGQIEKGRGYYPVWINVPRFLFGVRREFNMKYEEDLVGDVLRKRYVVLDDLGAEHTTDWVTETIYIIVNSIWENGYNLIITSNSQPNELSERLGDRLISRILDICEVKQLGTKDRRLEE